MTGRRKVEKSTRSTSVSYEIRYDRVDERGKVVGEFYDEGYPTVGKAESALRRNLSVLGESRGNGIENVRIVRHRVTDVETVVERFSP